MGQVLTFGIDKLGDNQVLKFYIEGINDSFLPNKQNLLNEMINTIFELVFNTNIENRKIWWRKLEDRKRIR